MKDTKIPMVLFGIIAVVAVVGMVLMFVQERDSAGMMSVSLASNKPGWYTNYPELRYPYDTTRVPVNVPAGSIQGDPNSKVPGDWYGVVNQERLISYVPGMESRSPYTIPSALTSCGRGYAKYSYQEAVGKINDPENWHCTPIQTYEWGGPTGEIDIGKGAYVCCAQLKPMVDHYTSYDSNSLA